MSKVKIQGNASGTGVVTLTAPNTNTDRTITLPDSSDTLVSTAPSTSGNILTSDGTNWTSAAGGADTSLSNLSATGENRVAQAWVRFNGTGTVAINDSHNISSIVDNAVGHYTVIFSNNLGNTDFSVTSGVNSINTWGTTATVRGFATSGFQTYTADNAGTLRDVDFISFNVFGD